MLEFVNFLIALFFFLGNRCRFYWYVVLQERGRITNLEESLTPGSAELLPDDVEKRNSNKQVPEQAEVNVQNRVTVKC